MPQDLVLDGFPRPQIPGTDTTNIKSIFSEPNQILPKLYLPKNATIGHFEYPRYSQGTDNGSNEFPTAKNLGLDTKIKSLQTWNPHNGKHTILPYFWFSPRNIWLVIKITAQTILDRSGGHYFSCIVLQCAEPKKIVWV